METPPQPPPPCSCPVADYCPRHAMEKSAHLHKLCKTRDDYRSLFDERYKDPSFVLPCVCEGPGYCPRHGRGKTAAQVQLCKDNPEVRATWDGLITREELGDRPQATTPSPVSAPRSSLPVGTSDRRKAPPESPGLVRRVLTYASARARWVAAGRPVRSHDDTAALFATCVQCVNYKPDDAKPDEGQCRLCGCAMKRIGTTFNKLAWGTEGCPNKEPGPYWLPTHYAPGEEPASPPVVYSISTQQPRA